MNIIEAIKSGKPFKRPFTIWLSPQAIGDITLIFNRTNQPMIDHYGIYIEDLLADDWEIEEEKIEITRSQLEEAWKFIGHASSLNHQTTLERLFPLFKERLGFK